MPPSAPTVSVVRFDRLSFRPGSVWWWSFMEWSRLALSIARHKHR